MYKSVDETVFRHHGFPSDETEVATGASVRGFCSLFICKSSYLFLPLRHVCLHLIRVASHGKTFWELWEKEKKTYPTNQAPAQ
jgi:hypothetical protein